MTPQFSGKFSGGERGEIIAYLHCEIPGRISNPKKQVSPSAGTAELDDVDGDGPTMRETIPIYAGQAFRIGRARANDLVIENQSVSRFHAVFSASATGLVLSDLSSLNGTQLNGRRISTPVDTGGGDVVQIGSVKLTIELCRGAELGNISQPEEDTIVSTHTAKMSSVMVTVLVADVVGFTKMSQSLPPQDVADMLNRWFGRAVDAIVSNGGEIDKYIGDCVMALWRSPTQTPQNLAVKAVIAAEKILAETEALAQKGLWKYESEFPWRCRVALNSGEALMGSVGAAGTRDFTVLGDTVNVAFRLESLASSDGSSLVISDATGKLVHEFIPLRSLGQVILDGRKENVEIFTTDRGDG